MDNLIPAGNGSRMPAALAPVNRVAAPPASGTASDIRRLWSALAGRKWLIVAVTAAIVGPAAAYSFLAKPTYLSSVSMQIEPEAVKVLPYNAISDSLVKAPADFELYMKTQDQLLASPALIARTVESVKREFGSDRLPYVGQDFKSGLRTERVAGSQVVRISYESHDPRFSALAANTLAQEFIKLHLERKAETTRNATDFLQTQLVALRQKMEDAEAELARYAARHNILDAGGNRENVIRQRFGILNSQVTDAEREYIARRIEYEELQKVSRDNFPASLRTPEIITQENRMLQAEQELATLLSQFGENWPAVVRKKQELSLIRQQLADQKNAALMLARREAELRLNSARNTYEMLNHTYREQQSLVNRLNEAEIQYNTLKRDVDAGNQLYQGLLQRLKETGVSAALELANMHITDAAVRDRSWPSSSVTWTGPCGARRRSKASAYLCWDGFPLWFPRRRSAHDRATAERSSAATRSWRFLRDPRRRCRHPCRCWPSVTGTRANITVRSWPRCSFPRRRRRRGASWLPPRCRSKAKPPCRSISG